MKIKTALTITALLALLIFCAGCVTDSPVKTEPSEIPLDMYQALNELGSDIISLEHIVLSDLRDVADSLGETDARNVYTILDKCYAEHPCITAIIYRDTVHNCYYSAPVFIDVDLSDFSAHITEKDFIDSGGLIVRNNVFSKYHGYQNLYYKPVYVDGKYHGYVLFVIDVYSLLYLHPTMLGEDKSYSGYICVITNNENRIIYSSMEEYVNKVLPAEGLYDTLVYIPVIESGDGACKYTSRGYYIYDEDTETEKITVWHTLYSSHGQKYTIYLIGRLNLPELKTKDVITVSAQQAVNDTLGACVYGTLNEFDKLKERIESGYYSTPLVVMNYNGDIVASSDKRKTGLNYLNSRGMYGVSFVESAIFTAEQGGGYIYYLTPAERVIYPRAAEYTLGIVMPFGEDYFIYGKTAGSADLILKDKELRPDLTRLSHTVMHEVSLNGIDSVIDTINSNGKDAAKIFVDDIHSEISDMAILDVEGNVYASVAFNELVGKSATFVTDVYGGSATRKMNILAKTGGGYMAQLYQNKDKEGYVDLWVAAVEPIDSKYYIYTAALIGTCEDVLSPVLENTAPTE